MNASVRQTTCSRDCPDVCTILVELDPQGQPVKLKGSAADPVTQGFLCERTSRFLDRQRDPERFVQPMWRPAKGQPLQPVSWDFALDLAARKLLEARAALGPASVLHYRSGGSMGLLKNLSELLFERFGPVTLKRGDICSGAGEAAQELDFGLCDSHDHTDLLNSRAILLWGKNIHTSSPHLTPLLMQARQKGARLLSVDCLRTRQATLVDHFVQIAPGTDFALAMAVARKILAAAPVDARAFCDHFEEFAALAHSREDWADLCGATPEDVQVLAEALLQRPAAILVGWGMARRRHGGAAVRALDALGAVSGNLGIAGGGVSYYFRRRSAFDGVGLSGLEAAPRSFAEACLGREMLAADPPVRVAWVTAGNPVSMLPDSDTVRRAFQAVETVVVVETHPTDTTDVADLVLPTLTLLEDDDLLGAYGNHYLRASRPALDPPGEARHELWIWQNLAARLGLPEGLLGGTPRQWKERLMVRLREAGVELADLERGPVRNPFAGQILFADGKFPTATGKVQLVTEAPPFPPPDPAYPFQLAAFSTAKAQASQWAVAPSNPPIARMHPSTQAPGRVLLETRQGRMVVQVQLDPAVHPRMIVLSKGGMLRTGGCPNQLVRAEETDLGGGANYYDEPVRWLPQ